MTISCWSLLVSILQINFHGSSSNEDNSQYSMPEGWHGDANLDDLKKVLRENTTIPGFDPVMMDKMKDVMDYVNTLPEDFDATVDRYNTPEFPTLATDKILQEKYQAITDYVETAGYDTHFMVNHLIGKGYLKSRRIAQAMREVDKSEFAPMDPLNKGHFDYPIDLGYGTWMEPPYQIAGSLEYMNRLLKPGSKILEIGAGTGYMTSLLALLGGHVVAIEHVPQLAGKIKNNMMNGAPRVCFRENFEIICADGRNGLKEKGPYDVIYVSASFPDPPVHIVKDQLKFGGRMIYTNERPGTGRHALCVYHRFANESDEVDCIHTSIFLPPLTDLKTQLHPQNEFKYNASRILRSERWFTGDYYGCYFDRSQKETRMFASEYDNPTSEIPHFGLRSPMWWNRDEDESLIKK